MLCDCNNVLQQYFATMFCNNVSVLCLHVIVKDYYVLIGEIACNKYPVLLLLFKYLGATLTENGYVDAEMAHTIQSEWKYWKSYVLCGRIMSLMVNTRSRESSLQYKTVVGQAMM